MGLASALSTALTGLNAAETTIDVVGNNIANSNTVGFKASEAVFATQFLQSQSLGSAPTGTSGGTNPRQTGLGTKVAEITPDFTQGTIEISSNPSDLAIQGDGFFIVRASSGEELFTRNGLFKTNSENDLVTVSGQRLLGYGVNEDFELIEELTSLNIPLGSEFDAQPTRNVTLEGILPPNGILATAEEILQSGSMSDGSVVVPANLGASDIGAVTAPNIAPVGTAGATTGGSTLTGGSQYEYKVVFIDDGQELAPSAAISHTLGGGENEIALSSIPSSGSLDFRIYRRDVTAGDTTFARVTELTSGTTAYTDTGSSTGEILDESTLAQGNYSYHVTFVNTSNGLESRPTAVAGPVAVNTAGQRVRIQNIPQPVPSGPDAFDSIRVYRSLSTDANDIHLLAEFSGGQATYVDSASDSSIASTAVINFDSPTISDGTKLVNITVRDGATYETPFEIGTLEFTGRKGGRTLRTQSLDITANTDIATLRAFMEESFGIHTDITVPGTPGSSLTIGTTSQLQFTGNRGGDNAIEIGLSSLQMITTDAVTGAVSTDALNLGFSATQAAIGESSATDFVVYDSSGSPLNVRLTVVMESQDSNSTVYRWFADSPDNDPSSGVDISVGTGTVSFDGEGNLIGDPNATASIARDSVPAASPLEFEFDFSLVSGLAADAASLSASRQDGSTTGSLTSFLIGEDGTIRGVFSNGVTQTLGQIRLARFANASGLEQRGENLYARGVNSGLPIEDNPGANGIGTVIAGAVELSNTDVGQNLIDLILASTQYRGGTRVITAVQQLFDELLALRR